MNLLCFLFGHKVHPWGEENIQGALMVQGKFHAKRTCKRCGLNQHIHYDTEITIQQINDPQQTHMRKIG